MTDANALSEAAAASLRDRLSVQISESDFSVACVASPVQDPSGACVATISIVLPEHRVTRARERYTRAVRAAADRTKPSSAGGDRSGRGGARRVIALGLRHCRAQLHVADAGDAVVGRDRFERRHDLGAGADREQAARAENAARRGLIGLGISPWSITRRRTACGSGTGAADRSARV